MTHLVSIALVWIVSLPLLAADSPAVAPAARPVESAGQSWIKATPTPYGPLLMQQAPPPPYRDYQMNRVLTPEERARWLQMAMPMMDNMMQMDAREAMNYFAVKYQAKPGVSFDEVIDSIKLRANRLNLKFIGSNPISKDFQAILNDTTAPRVEILSFCDIALARDLLRAVPEIAVFLPCRIVVMADADKNIWVMTLDWDATRLNLAGQLADITPELRQGVLDIREKLDNVMRAGANGEL